VDVAPNDELRRLRERAYGPGADIHDDAEALARLHELEVAQRLAEPPLPAAMDPMLDPAPDGEADPASDPESDHAPDRRALDDAPVPPGGDPQEGEPDATAQDDRPARLSRRTRWLWAGSVAAALIVGAGLTMATSSVAGGRVAVLAEDEPSAWPANMFGDAQEGSQIFQPFHGVRALVVQNAWGNSDTGLSCVFVVRAEGEDDAAPTTEILTTGCGDAGFAPTASFEVTDASPDELRDRFGVGTGLRIVIEGDEAHVFARTP
jgi:hypothetical protein